MNTLKTINQSTNQQQVSTHQIRVTKKASQPILPPPQPISFLLFFFLQNVNLTLGHRDTKGAPKYAADSRFRPSKS